MDPRDGLHTKLCDILASFGVWLWDPFDFEVDDTTQAIEQEAKRHVYFQPPSGFQMQFPCIVYTLGGIDTKFADNHPYKLEPYYNVTVIDKNPDSQIPYKIAELPKSRFNRHYTIDNLHHFVFIVYP